MEYLFQRGNINGIFGQSGVGKTWVALGAAAQFLQEGEAVTWFCFECDNNGPVNAAECMIRLHRSLEVVGVGDNQRDAFHHYPNPPADWWQSQQYETSPTGLVVFDGMREEHDHEAYIQPFHTSVPTATVVVTELSWGDPPDREPRLYRWCDEAEGVIFMGLDQMFSPGHNSPTDHTYRIV